jgi:hypothetical protein
VKTTRKIYGKLRRRLLQRGTNLRQWALERGLPVGSVYNCVKGERNGAKAIRIRRELEKFLGEGEKLRRNFTAEARRRGASTPKMVGRRCRAAQTSAAQQRGPTCVGERRMRPIGPAIPEPPLKHLHD